MSTLTTLTQILDKKNYVSANVPGQVKEIQYFKTWFNENLAIIISFHHPSKYEATLVIYEHAEKRMDKVLVFKSIASDSSLDNVRKEVDIFRKNLNGDNPAVYFPFPENIIKTVLPFKNIFPDNYIKPLDIIKIQSDGYEHVAIYLIDGKLYQVEGTDGKFNGLLKLNSAGARIVDWATFLGDNPEKVTRYHAAVPFKRTEKIIEHIERALLSDYDERNFVNMCVYGMENMEKYLETERGTEVDVISEIKDNDKMFTNLKITRQLTVDEEQTIEKLQRSIDDDTLEGSSPFLEIFGTVTLFVAFILRHKMMYLMC